MEDEEGSRDHHDSKTGPMLPCVFVKLSWNSKQHYCGRSLEKWLSHCLRWSLSAGKRRNYKRRVNSSIWCCNVLRRQSKSISDTSVCVVLHVSSSDSYLEASHEKDFNHNNWSWDLFSKQVLNPLCHPSTSRLASLCSLMGKFWVLRRGWSNEAQIGNTHTLHFMVFRSKHKSQRMLWITAQVHLLKPPLLLPIQILYESFLFSSLIWKEQTKVMVQHKYTTVSKMFL